MAGFVRRDGGFSPIKFFLTLLWSMYFIVFILMVVTIILVMKGRAHVDVALIQVLMNGVVALTVQLVATTGLDTWRQNVKTKEAGSVKNQSRDL